MQVEKLKVTLTILTGLHIGASKEIAEIGGLDAPVIRNPITQEPYIPGSSLKGKMRCLVEMAKNKFGKRAEGFNGQDGGPCSCGLRTCPICRVFGALPDEKKEFDPATSCGPTRLIVRDAELDENGRKMYYQRLSEGLPTTEIKTETAIDRLKGSVKTGSLRTQERVPPGYTFSFEIIYRRFLAKDGEADEDKQLIEEALKLLEADTLGKSGSRGYGQVDLEWDKWEPAV